jgi:hypothetical protein
MFSFRRPVISKLRKISLPNLNEMHILKESKSENVMGVSFLLYSYLTSTPMKITICGLKVQKE